MEKGRIIHPVKKIAEIVVVKTMGSLQKMRNHRASLKIAEIVVVKTMGLPWGSLQQGNSGNLQQNMNRFEGCFLTKTQRESTTVERLAMELDTADKALGAADMVRSRTCSVMAKMIVDLTYEQAILNADGGLSIDILKPRALVYELFAGFARTVSQRMAVDDLESESGKFCLLQFLQQTSEDVGASLRLEKEQQPEAHALNALVLIQCAVNEAKSVLDGCKVRVRSAEATLASTNMRKRRMTSDEARDGEVAGGVVAALAPLTRLLVWLMKHSQLPPVDGEDVRGFLEDMQSLTVSLELGASHLSRMIEVNKMLAAGLRDQMKNADQSPVVKKLRVQLQEKTDTFIAFGKDTWNMLDKSTLMITDSRGVIQRLNPYGQRLTSMEEKDVVGMKISELCANGSEVETLLANLNEDKFEAQSIEVVLNTKASSMNIMLTLCDFGCGKIIWNGQDVTCHHRSMDDLQKRLLASEQENSNLRASHQSMDDLQKRLLASEQENSKLKAKAAKMRALADEA